MDFMVVGAWLLMAALVVFRVAFFVGFVWLAVIIWKAVREEILRGRLVEAEAASGIVPATRQTSSLD